jgi:uncharacterized membrane protein
MDRTFIAPSLPHPPIEREKSGFAISKMNIERWQPELFFIVTLIVVSAVLRVFLIGREAYWADEAFSVTAARMQSGQIWNNALKEPISPFYYLLLHYWTNLFGVSETATRMLSALFNLGLCLLVYGFGRDILDKKMFLPGVILVAASPLLIWYAQEVRTYSLVAFFAMAATWLFARGLRNPLAWGNWLGYIAFAVLAVLAHYFAGFLIITQLALGFGWLVISTRWQIWGSVLAGMVVLGSIGLWLVLPAVFQVKGTNVDYRTALRPADMPLTFWRNIITDLNFGKAEIHPFLKLVGFLVFSLAFAAGAFHLWKNNKLIALLLLGSIIGPLMLAGLASLSVNILEAHYLLFIAPPYYLVTGLGLVTLRPKFLRWSISIIMLALVITGLVGQDANLLKPDYRSLAAVLEDVSKQEQSVIIFNPGFWDLPYSFYEKTRSAQVLGYANGTFVQTRNFQGSVDADGRKLAGWLEANKQILSQAKNIWIVEPPGELNQVLREYFSQHFRLVVTYNLAQIVLLNYQCRC